MRDRAGHEAEVEDVAEIREGRDDDDGVGVKPAGVMKNGRGQHGERSYDRRVWIIRSAIFPMCAMHACGLEVRAVECDVGGQ